MRRDAGDGVAAPGRGAQGGGRQDTGAPPAPERLSAPEAAFSGSHVYRRPAAPFRGADGDLDCLDSTKLYAGVSIATYW